MSSPLLWSAASYLRSHRCSLDYTYVLLLTCIDKYNFITYKAKKATTYGSNNRFLSIFVVNLKYLLYQRLLDLHAAKMSLNWKSDIRFRWRVTSAIRGLWTGTPTRSATWLNASFRSSNGFAGDLLAMTNATPRFTKNSCSSTNFARQISVTYLKSEPGESQILQLSGEVHTLCDLRHSCAS